MLPLLCFYFPLGVSEAWSGDAGGLKRPSCQTQSTRSSSYSEPSAVSRSCSEYKMVFTPRGFKGFRVFVAGLQLFRGPERGGSAPGGRRGSGDSGLAGASGGAAAPAPGGRVSGRRFEPLHLEGHRKETNAHVFGCHNI